ncbi:hypothetical protein DRN98_04630 [Methanosarcinales archaeon]|nr:MAG: hypothetical protein DRN98_04630 [Methanosarcinales archaeon]
MNYSDWEPIYEEILDYFGYDRCENDRSARILERLIGDRDLGIEELEAIVRGKEVLVCGNAPTLCRDLESFDVSELCVIAADGATSTLIKEGILPDLIVTDLDGTIGDIIYANRMGSVVVVLAHGDNIKEIRSVVPNLTSIIGTTHGRPFKSIYNFGGFTDGDRAVFLADALGACRIMLAGFDFEDDTVSEVKHQKLMWAKRLIEGLLNNNMGRDLDGEGDRGN